MTSDSAPIEIVHEESAQRGAFAVFKGTSRVGELTYRLGRPGVALVDHTEVDPSLKGQGIARRLVDALVSWARGAGVSVVPLCSYVAAQFEKDPSTADVLDKSSASER